MTYQEFMGLSSYNITNFSDGKKPTYAQWIKYFQAYAGAIQEPLGLQYVTNIVDNAGFKEGAVVTNAMLKQVFTDLYSQSNFAQENHIPFIDAYFSNGSKPTGVDFRNLNSMPMIYGNVKVKIQIDLQCMNNFISGNSSSGLQYQLYDNRDLTVADSSQVGGYLIQQGNYAVTATLEVPTMVPILQSPLIACTSVGFSWSVYARNMYIFDETTGTNIAVSAINMTSGNMYGINISQIMQLTGTQNNLVVYVSAQ